MSEYHVVELEIKDESCLVEALHEMNYKPEIHKKAKALIGYKGDKRSQKAHIIIPKNQIGSVSNDIGFERMNNGDMKMRISEYDINSHKFNTNKLKQLYAKYKTISICKKKKYKLVSQKTDDKGRIRIKLTST